jgi:hypothetical protein
MSVHKSRPASSAADSCRTGTVGCKTARRGLKWPHEPRIVRSLPASFAAVPSVGVTFPARESHHVRKVARYRVSGVAATTSETLRVTARMLHLKNEVNSRRSPTKSQMCLGTGEGKRPLPSLGLLGHTVVSRLAGTSTPLRTQ